MNTLLLDRSTWDLVIDAQQNIAVASGPYALAQDAASEIRAFQGEVYYDATQGVPYWTQVLGQFPALSLIKAQFVAAAMRVPGVTSARCFISSFSNRKVGGQVQITDASGNTLATGF